MRPPAPTLFLSLSLPSVAPLSDHTIRLGIAKGQTKDSRTAHLNVPRPFFFLHRRPRRCRPAVWSLIYYSLTSARGRVCARTERELHAGSSLQKTQPDLWQIGNRSKLSVAADFLVRARDPDENNQMNYCHLFCSYPRFIRRKTSPKDPVRFASDILVITVIYQALPKLFVPIRNIEQTYQWLRQLRLALSLSLFRLPV